MQRWIGAAFLLLASSAFAYENPIITPSIIKLKPGETATLALTTWWSGLSAYPQHNVFASDAPEVAEASGSLSWVGDFSAPPVLEPIKVKALAPGVAHVTDHGFHGPYATIVVTCDPPGTGIAFPTVPEGKARIRLIVTSEHTRAQLDQALETLERVAKRMGILQ